MVCELNTNRNEWVAVDEAIAKRLQPLRDYLKDEDVLVRALPDVAAGFGERTDSGDLYHLVRSGAAIEQQNRDGENVTSETWVLLVVILLPALYTEKGLYPVVKKCRDLLIGYRPPYSISAIRASRRGWDFKRDVAVWVCEINLEFDINILETEQLIDDKTPLIKQISIASAGQVQQVEVVA